MPLVLQPGRQLPFTALYYSTPRRTALRRPVSYQDNPALPHQKLLANKPVQKGADGATPPFVLDISSTVAIQPIEVTKLPPSLSAALPALNLTDQTWQVQAAMQLAAQQVRQQELADLPKQDKFTEDDLPGVDWRVKDIALPSTVSDVVVPCRVALADHGHELVAAFGPHAQEYLEGKWQHLLKSAGTHQAVSGPPQPSGVAGGQHKLYAFKLAHGFVHFIDWVASLKLHFEHARCLIRLIVPAAQEHVLGTLLALSVCDLRQDAFSLREDVLVQQSMAELWLGSAADPSQGASAHLAGAYGLAYGTPLHSSLSTGQARGDHQTAFTARSSPGALNGWSVSVDVELPQLGFLEGGWDPVCTHNLGIIMEDAEHYLLGVGIELCQSVVDGDPSDMLLGGPLPDLLFHITARGPQGYPARVDMLQQLLTQPYQAAVSKPPGATAAVGSAS